MSGVPARAVGPPQVDGKPVEDGLVHSPWAKIDSARMSSIRRKHFYTSRRGVGLFVEDSRTEAVGAYTSSLVEPCGGGGSSQYSNNIQNSNGKFTKMSNSNKKVFEQHSNNIYFFYCW